MYMTIRRDRSHICGHTNIDFRTKNDTESIKTFMPWKQKREFGTMGNDLYKLPYNENKKILKVTENINNQKNILHEIPDPKYYKTAQYYQSNNIPLKSKTMFESERVAQLDESFKGKEKYTGDGMMISDIMKQRKLKIESEERMRLLSVEKAKKDSDTKDIENGKNKKELIIIDKNEKNKSSYHETQLQKIEAEETLEKKVDLNKLKEIRLALRRRYAPRTNYRKIFKEWDTGNLGEISVYDAHNMINKLSIPINIDETRALVSSSNTRGTESLDMQEFMHLIFNDNEELNLKVKNISNKDDRFQTEGEKLDFFKKSMINKISETASKDCLKYLIEYMRLVIPKVAKKLNLYSEDKQHCDLQTFKNVIGNFQIPQKFIEDNIVNSIFEKFQSSDNKEQMNYRNFIDFVIEGQETNDFFNYKKKFISTIEQKLDNLGGKIVEKSSYLKNAIDDKIFFKENLRKEIEEKKNYKSNQNYLDDKITNKNTLTSKFEKELNAAQPSLNYMNKLFKNKDEYFERKNAIENTFTANPQYFSQEKRKTRFNANPVHKDTFYIIAPPKEASSYIDEKKRFDVRCKWDVDFQLEEKQKKMKIENKIFERKRKINEMINQKIQEKENYLEQKDHLSQIVRTQKLYKYESKNLRRNEVIE